MILFLQSIDEEEEFDDEDLDIDESHDDSADDVTQPHQSKASKSTKPAGRRAHEDTHDSESAHVLKRAKKKASKTIDEQIDDFDDFTARIEQAMEPKKTSKVGVIGNIYKYILCMFKILMDI